MIAWTEFKVASPAELLATVRAAAYSEDDPPEHVNPIKIYCGSATYVFSSGITVERARYIARNIYRTPAWVFKEPA